MAFNPAEEARLAEEAKRIAASADGKERGAALAKAALAETDKGAAFDYLSAQISALEQQSKHTLAADVGSFNTELGKLRAEVSPGLNGKGMTGGSATVLTGVMDDKTFGAASVGVTGSMNGKGELGDPTLSARWVSPALIDSKDSRLEAVAISAVGVTIPTNDRQFAGADVSIAIGGVVFDKPTGVALTGLASTDGTGKDPALWGRVSGNVYEDANTRLAANLNGGFDTASQQGNAGLGLFAEHKLNKTSTVYASAGATVNDVGGKNELAAMFTLGATFDMMPTTKAAEKTAAAPSNNEALPSQLNAVATQAKPASAQTENIAKYDFLELAKTDQQKVLAIMAKAYQSAYPDVSPKQARETILQELTAANYFVDSHGTKTFKDDTLVQTAEHSLSR